MAADTRPYKSKEQDGQGNELIIRDQQLVEQASQTTMASGEYFEIVDVDGRMAKIPKANMVDIVREALGSLLNGLSDQTTVTKVPSLNGNTLGASTVATLASVLGEKLRITTINTIIPANDGQIDVSVPRSGICFFSNVGGGWVSIVCWSYDLTPKELVHLTSAYEFSISFSNQDSSLHITSTAPTNQAISMIVIS